MGSAQWDRGAFGRFFVFFCFFWAESAWFGPLLSLQIFEIMGNPFLSSVKMPSHHRFSSVESFQVRRHFLMR